MKELADILHLHGLFGACNDSSVSDQHKICGFIWHYRKYRRFGKTVICICKCHENDKYDA